MKTMNHYFHSSVTVLLRETHLTTAFTKLVAWQYDFLIIRTENTFMAPKTNFLSFFSFNHYVDFLCCTLTNIWWKPLVTNPSHYHPHGCRPSRALRAHSVWQILSQSVNRRYDYNLLQFKQFSAHVDIGMTIHFRYRSLFFCLDSIGAALYD